MKPRTRRVKAWAVVDRNRGYWLYIRGDRGLASELAGRRGDLIVPCTITYALPPKKARNRS